jgi:hypothetical protein
MIKPSEKQAAPVTDPEDIYKPRRTENGFTDAPCCIYFYYIGQYDSKIKTWPVKHYYFTNGLRPIPYEEVESRVRKLSINARKGGSDPPQYGADWKYLVWSRKCYIAILIDDPTIKFVGEALKIDNTKGKPNHALFDGKDVITNSAAPNEPQRMVPLFYCINHMKDEYDGNLGETAEYFELVLNSTLPKKARLYPDSGGTNMGPPVPPP